MQGRFAESPRSCRREPGGEACYWVLPALAALSAKGRMRHTGWPPPGLVSHPNFHGLHSNKPASVLGTLTNLAPDEINTAAGSFYLGTWSSQDK